MKCYLYEKELYVSQLIELAKDYPDYDVYTNGDNGIIINIDDNKTVYIERYIFNDLMFGFDNSDDYFNFLNTSIIYYHIKVRDLIEILKPYKDYKLEISGCNESVLYLGNNIMNFDDIGLCCCDCFVAGIQNTDIDFTKVN